jgi:hypothetical protein
LINPLEATPVSVREADGITSGAPLELLPLLLVLPPPPQAAKVEVSAHARVSRVKFMPSTKIERKTYHYTTSISVKKLKKNEQRLYFLYFLANTPGAS